jgi:hypothetical protein
MQSVPGRKPGEHTAVSRVGKPRQLCPYQPKLHQGVIPLQQDPMLLCALGPMLLAVAVRAPNHDTPMVDG